jgi:hypothetical protein
MTIRLAGEIIGGNDCIIKPRRAAACSQGAVVCVTFDVWSYLSLESRRCAAWKDWAEPEAERITDGDSQSLYFVPARKHMCYGTMLTM